MLAVAILVTACGAGSTESSLESRAQGINKSLMCPVCPSETIDQAQVELAAQMRTIVLERLAAGETREQILQFFVDRYGESVLAEPSKRGFNLLIWVAPPVGLLGGAVLLYVILLSMRRSAQGRLTEQPSSVPVATAEVLEPYLERVDMEMESMGVVGPGNTAEKGRD
ncbi:MAG: cytochrome c-type biogenesis protein CcmH [Chloroflexi bacterium]|nr:cytochrome c-type biogenesis protein CcmH [Chloroflexota bacterium]